MAKIKMGNMNIDESLVRVKAETGQNYADPKALTIDDLVKLRRSLIEAHADVTHQLAMWDTGFGSVDDMRDDVEAFIRVWDIVEFVDRTRRDLI